MFFGSDDYRAKSLLHVNQNGFFLFRGLSHISLGCNLNLLRPLVMSLSTRRTHTKSRKGCQTCKNRRVRCDEFFPQCRNCTKRGIRCAYMDDSAASEGSLSSAKLTEFSWPSEIENGVEEWQRTKSFPFTHMQLANPPSVVNLSTEDCRLVYHVCLISRDLESSDSTKFTTWAHRILEYAVLKPIFYRGPYHNAIGLLLKS